MHNAAEGVVAMDNEGSFLGGNRRRIVALDAEMAETSAVRDRLILP